MKLLKSFAQFCIFVSAVSLIFWLIIGWLANPTAPNPFKFWDSYGFRVGGVYVATPINVDPFSVPKKPDTLVVAAIVADYVQFTNGRVDRLGSFGMSCYDWKIIK